MHAESVSKIHTKAADGQAKLAAFGSLTRHTEKHRETNFLNTIITPGDESWVMGMIQKEVPVITMEVQYITETKKENCKCAKCQSHVECFL